MSDYQFVHFLACDVPLDEKQLDFMREQSPSARITEWEFIDEYHGKFNGGNFFQGGRGEMLRHGYDAHLDYISIGVRCLEFHLPGGPPCGQKLMKTFQMTLSVEWNADHNHFGPVPENEWTMPGILTLNPAAENDDAYKKGPFDPAPLLRQIAPVRKLLALGDVRPLYLSWLAGFYSPEDENSLEPPVPAGLCRLPPELQAMAVFFGLAPKLIAAAAARSPALPDQDVPAMQWPMAEPTRSLAQLRKAAKR